MIFWYKTGITPQQNQTRVLESLSLMNQVALTLTPLPNANHVILSKIHPLPAHFCYLLRCLASSTNAEMSKSSTADVMISKAELKHVETRLSGISLIGFDRPSEINHFKITANATFLTTLEGKPSTS